jgi:hypothetical protein
VIVGSVAGVGCSFLPRGVDVIEIQGLRHIHLRGADLDRSIRF